MRQQRETAYSSGVLVLYECVLYKFEYLTGFHIRLPQIKTHHYKVNRTPQNHTVFSHIEKRFTYKLQIIMKYCNFAISFLYISKAQSNFHLNQELYWREDRKFNQPNNRHIQLRTKRSIARYYHQRCVCPTPTQRCARVRKLVAWLTTSSQHVATLLPSISIILPSPPYVTS